MYYRHLQPFEIFPTRQAKISYKGLITGTSFKKKKKSGYLYMLPLPQLMPFQELRCTPLVTHLHCNIPDREMRKVSYKQRIAAPLEIALFKRQKFTKVS